MEFQEEKPNFITKSKNFIKECTRILRVTKKPTMQEFKIIVKVSAIGIAIIGLIGSLIQILWILIKP